MSVTLPERQASEDLRAPAASDFSPFPASWYRLCASRDIDRSPFARTVFNRRLVGYRDSNGAAGPSIPNAKEHAEKIRIKAEQVHIKYFFNYLTNLFISEQVRVLLGPQSIFFYLPPRYTRNC